MTATTSFMMASFNTDIVWTILWPGSPRAERANENPIVNVIMPRIFIPLRETIFLERVIGQSSIRSSSVSSSFASEQVNSDELEEFSAKCLAHAVQSATW